jgi:hypothetical protein
MKVMMSTAPQKPDPTVIASKTIMPPSALSTHDIASPAAVAAFTDRLAVAPRRAARRAFEMTRHAASAPRAQLSPAWIVHVGQDRDGWTDSPATTAGAVARTSTPARISLIVTKLAPSKGSLSAQTGTS